MYINYKFQCIFLSHKCCNLLIYTWIKIWYCNSWAVEKRICNSCKVNQISSSFLWHWTTLVEFLPIFIWDAALLALNLFLKERVCNGFSNQLTFACIHIISKHSTIAITQDWRTIVPNQNSIIAFPKYYCHDKHC